MACRACERQGRSIQSGWSWQPFGCDRGAGEQVCNLAADFSAVNMGKRGRGQRKSSSPGMVLLQWFTFRTGQNVYRFCVNVVRYRFADKSITNLVASDIPDNQSNYQTNYALYFWAVRELESSKYQLPFGIGMHQGRVSCRF